MRFRTLRALVSRHRACLSVRDAATSICPPCFEPAVRAQSGLALLGGGGLMIHITHHFAIGAETDYQTITKTELQEFSIGPTIMISF